MRSAAACSHPPLTPPLLPPAPDVRSVAKYTPPVVESFAEPTQLPIHFERDLFVGPHSPIFAALLARGATASSALHHAVRQAAADVTVEASRVVADGRPAEIDAAAEACSGFGLSFVERYDGEVTACNGRNHSSWPSLALSPLARAASIGCDELL